jgi:transmembrane sensor
LVAEQMPLCTFLKQIADYRSSYVLCDTALQQYSISGIYSLDHSAEILQQLPQLFPIKISTYGHYFVRATPQS